MFGKCIGHTARPQDVAVRFFHGWRMSTTVGLWDEFGAVLQWPNYSGQNWDAFHDFLRNLDCKPGQAPDPPGWAEWLATR